MVSITCKTNDSYLAVLKVLRFEGIFKNSPVNTHHRLCEKLGTSMDIFLFYFRISQCHIEGTSVLPRAARAFGPLLFHRNNKFLNNSDRSEVTTCYLRHCLNWGEMVNMSAGSTTTQAIVT